MNERAKREQVDKIKNRQAERIWGGEIPDLGELSQRSDEVVDDVEAREQELRDNQVVQGIVKSWEDTGFEEDVRLRTSALSILGQLLEQATTELTPVLVDSAADTALSILSFEQGPGKTILRRAAVLMFMSLLRAMDEAHENRTEIATGLDGSKWLGIEKVLSWVIDVDEDDLVKGNAASVLEGLEAWRMKKIINASAENGISNTPTLGLDTLRGLRVTPGSNSFTGKMKVQEID
jgi:hypothetical protein